MKTELDLKGLYCPEPVMLLRSTVRKLNKGDELVIYTTDPATVRDIPDFCRFMDHTLLDDQTKEKPYEFTIRIG